MSDGSVRLTRDGPIAAILFDRPDAHNAMTWKMYQELGSICDALADDASVRVTTLRGAGGRAFVSGTDIAQFTTFKGADDGIRYEDRIDSGIAQIARLPMPTLAICEGWVMGGGLAIAAACDFRIATPDAKFGVPIARTLGNCLSADNVGRLVAGVGIACAKRMLLLADAIPAAECVATGFVLRIGESDAISALADDICSRLTAHAPLSMRASKETIQRLSAIDRPDIADLIMLCYGSADFKEGVDAFTHKRKPQFTGR